MRVMPIWTVERKRPGFVASLSARFAPRRPDAARALNRECREETTASSDSAKKPLRRMRPRTIRISITSCSADVCAPQPLLFTVAADSRHRSSSGQRTPTLPSRGRTITAASCRYVAARRRVWGWTGFGLGFRAVLRRPPWRAAERGSGERRPGCAQDKAASPRSRSRTGT